MTKRLSDLPEVAHFRDVATRYCELIDAHREFKLQQFLEHVERALPQLIPCVLDLPLVDRFGSDPPERDYAAMFRPLHSALAEYLGKHALHWRVFDPTKVTKDDPLLGDLADDLADIYCDLRRGLDAWDSADAATRREILWTWRFGYESHWGRHLVEALSAIYNLLGLMNLGRSTDPGPGNGAEADA